MSRRDGRRFGGGVHPKRFPGKFFREGVGPKHSPERRYREGVRGFALPMVAFAALAILLFVFTVSQLGQSTRSRITHLNKAQTCFHIGSSALSQFLARLHFTSWGNRDFKTTPVRKFQVWLMNGDYDLFAENTPGSNREFQADVYIRVRFAGMMRLFFWRILYRDDLLDISSRFFIRHFATIPPEKYPGSGGSSFSENVDQILAQRAQNQRLADELSMAVLGTSDVKRIAEILGVDSAGIADPTEVRDAVPPRPPGSALAGIPSIPFPNGRPGAFNDTPMMPPIPPTTGRPGAPAPGGAPGTGGTTGAGGIPGPTGTGGTGGGGTPSAPGAQSGGLPAAPDPIVPPPEPPPPAPPPTFPPAPPDPRASEPPPEIEDILCDTDAAVYTADGAEQTAQEHDPYSEVDPAWIDRPEMMELLDQYVAAVDKTMTEVQATRAAEPAVQEAAEVAKVAQNPGAISSLEAANAAVQQHADAADAGAQEVESTYKKIMDLDRKWRAERDQANQTAQGTGTGAAGTEPPTGATGSGSPTGAAGSSGSSGSAGAAGAAAGAAEAAGTAAAPPPEGG